MKENRLSLLEELTLEKKKGFKKMHQRQTQHILNPQVCRKLLLPALVHKYFAIPVASFFLEIFFFS